MQFAQWSFDEVMYQRFVAECLRISVEEAVKMFRQTGTYWKDEGKDKYVSENDGLVLTVTLTATNLRAWLENYGTGMRMDKTNPDYQRYINSDDFAHNSFHRNARLRNGGAIVYRGSEKYTRPNYKTGSGTITEAGKEPAGQLVESYKGVRGWKPAEYAWENYAIIRQKAVFETLMKNVNIRDFIVIKQEVM